jgi:hypothetical protein
LVQEFTEAFPLTSTWGAEMFGSGVDADSIGTAVSAGATEWHATIVANGDTEQIDVIAVGKVDEGA